MTKAGTCLLFGKRNLRPTRRHVHYLFGTRRELALSGRPLRPADRSGAVFNCLRRSRTSIVDTAAASVGLSAASAAKCGCARCSPARVDSRLRWPGARRAHTVTQKFPMSSGVKKNHSDGAHTRRLHGIARRPAVLNCTRSLGRARRRRDGAMTTTSRRS
jgi:hypothetical protein